MGQYPIGLILVILFGLYILFTSIRILQEYERAVIFRLGRFAGRGVKGPGLILLIPIIDKMVKVSLRTVVLDVTPQDVITQDNVSIKVNAVVYFRVLHPEKAIIQVENYLRQHPRFHRQLCEVYVDSRNWTKFFHNARRSTSNCSRSSTVIPNPGE